MSQKVYAVKHRGQITKSVRGGCCLALSQVTGEHKRLLFFGVHRVICTHLTLIQTFFCSKCVLISDLISFVHFPMPIFFQSKWLQNGQATTAGFKTNIFVNQQKTATLRLDLMQSQTDYLSLAIKSHWNSLIEASTHLKSNKTVTISSVMR